MVEKVHRCYLFFEIQITSISDTGFAFITKF